MPGSPFLTDSGGQPLREGPFKGLRRSLKLGRRGVNPPIPQLTHQHGGIFFITGHQGQDGDQDPVRDLHDHPTIGELPTLIAARRAQRQATSHHPNNQGKNPNENHGFHRVSSSMPGVTSMLH